MPRGKWSWNTAQHRVWVPGVPGLVPGVPLERPQIQAPQPSPVGAADAPSSTQGQVGLIHRLAVGLVVTQRDHQSLFGADPLTAPMWEKVGDIEWARPWGAWSPRCL